ncbi:MAG TPA: DUF4189 domain-containing protein [Mycobacterium sp.]|nr:DUF4189 domain-containing protein [Mycobacterium sp.]
MAKPRTTWAAIAVAVIAIAGASMSTAWAGGPPGVVEDPVDIAEAVGTGVFDGALVGFRATGDTNDEASANVIAACERAGGQECTSDEVTNDNLCIVSVADDNNDVVAGGAGVTVEVAREDALRRAAANGTPLPPTATTVISACP